MDFYILYLYAEDHQCPIFKPGSVHPIQEPISEKHIGHAQLVFNVHGLMKFILHVDTNQSFNPYGLTITQKNGRFVFLSVRFINSQTERYMIMSVPDIEDLDAGDYSVFDIENINKKSQYNFSKYEYTNDGVIIALNLLGFKASNMDHLEEILSADEFTATDSTKETETQTINTKQVIHLSGEKPKVIFEFTEYLSKVINEYKFQVKIPGCFDMIPETKHPAIKYQLN